jgi:hypothetical protein
VCGGDVRIDPSLFWGDAPCPKCGTLLWFIGNPPEDYVFYEYEAAEFIRERFLERLSKELGVSKHELEANPVWARAKVFDSLDLLEVMMELEELDSGNGPSWEE